MASQLGQQRDHSDRMLRRAKQMAEMRTEAQANLARETESLRAMGQRVRKLANDLQISIEANCSRPCHILGIPALD